MPSTETSGRGDIARTLELLWEGGTRASRGPKPGLTIDRITEAALGLADAEGLDAVTMRRVATELGTGTMTLYRYLPGKAELLDLMLDRVNRPDQQRSEVAGDWRWALTAMACEIRDRYRRHPWLLQVDQSRPVIGPSSVEGLELVLSQIRAMGLTDQELISVIVMIDGYVSGSARSTFYTEQAERASGMTEEEFWNAQSPVLTQAMNSGRYPTLAALADNAFGSEFDHFTFGLERILDGLAELIARRAEIAEPGR